MAALSVRAAVRRDLAAIRKIDPDLAKSGLAAIAMALATELDLPEGTPADKATCARALNATLAQLRELCPPPAKADVVDDLKKRREERRASRRAGT